MAVWTQLAAQPATAAQESNRLEIDLPAAVRLADERNVDVAIFLARVEAATARLAQARLAAVPSLRVGTTEERHEGTIQETSGNVVDVDRAARFRGSPEPVRRSRPTDGARARPVLAARGR